MAKQDTVYSLFGMETPQEAMARQFKESFAYTPGTSGYSRLGAGLGQALGTLFGGPSQDVQKAQRLEEISQQYQPGNLQNMAETYSKLQQAGAPAETLQKLSSDITAASEAYNQRARAQRAKNAAVKYVSDNNPQLGKLLEEGGIEAKDAVEAIQKSKEPIKVGDFLVNYDSKTKQAAIAFDGSKREPQQTYTILTDDEKKTNGLPVNIQYQRNNTTGKIERIAGADVPVGAPPQGYQYVVDTDAEGRSVTRMQVIPGSPQADELKKAQERVSNGKRAKYNKFTYVVGPAIDTAIAIAQNDDNWAAGMPGAFVEQLGKLSGGVLSAESSRLALTEQLTVIRADIGFSKLQDMRDNSPTGGALGQVALQELYFLQTSLAPLNPNMKAEELVTSLEKIKTHYRKAVEAIANDLTDEQLLAEGLGELIPFRTARKNPDGSYTPLEDSAADFDTSVLPDDVRAGWDQLDDDTKNALIEAYKQ